MEVSWSGYGLWTEVSKLSFSITIGSCSVHGHAFSSTRVSFNFKQRKRFCLRKGDSGDKVLARL